MSHRMSYVRYLKEVGAPILEQVDTMDAIQEEIRRLEAKLDSHADDLRGRVEELWTHEELPEAWKTWVRAGCPAQRVEPRKVGMDPAHEAPYGDGEQK